VTAGATVTPGGLTERLGLLGVLSGAWVAQGCSVLAELGVPDLLAGGPRSAAELAGDCGADPAALHRLLRALATAGLLTEPAPGRFALTPTSALLRTDVPGSVRPVARVYGREVFRAFGGLLGTVRTGRPAFETEFGRPFYDHVRTDPELGRTVTAAQTRMGVPATLAGADLPATGTLVDAGGGDGAVLAALLTRHPGLRGVLVELPETAALAADRFAAAGLADRVELVPGSFFDPLPAGDAYVLARVLHNWGDERAGAILDRVRAALPPAGRLLVVEDLVPATAPAAAPGSPTAAARLVDLLMLAVLEGRDRTEAEYRELLGAHGFTVTGVRAGRRGGADSLIEGRPA
jgi:hypothetical protein